MKISIITPSFNSGKYIERAINSVLKQDYKCYEHIIVDGDSRDNTAETLESYSHLKWISEPDKGQSDAMNKGFEMSTGDIIVYLNADDFFEEGVFDLVEKVFQNNPEKDMVLGNLLQTYPDKPNFLQNNYSIDFTDILFQKKEFPYNPVAYFYKRSLQDKIGDFPVEEHYTMDYWFLLHAYFFGKLVKVDSLFGYFDMTGENKSILQNSFIRQGEIALDFCEKYCPEKLDELKYFQKYRANSLFERIKNKIRIRTRLNLLLK